MKKIIRIAFVGLVVAASEFGAFAAPEVTDVIAKQRYPWNGLVDIGCTVSGIEGTTNGLYLTLATVDQDSGKVCDVSHFWVVQGGTNSTDREVHESGEYRIVWDARADLGSVIYSNMVVRVSLSPYNEIDSHGKVRLWEDGPYWSDTNLGAEEPSEYGHYFWWGDTIGYKRQSGWTASDGSSSGFSFASGYASTYDKDVATLKSDGWITDDNVLAPEHDAAQVQWGMGWRMPTYQELYDLRYNKCDWNLTTTNGVLGYLVRGRGSYAGSSIFLPAAGYGLGTSLYWGGEDGYYWSSEPVSTTYAWCLCFVNSGVAKLDSFGIGRSTGRSIRPVKDFRATTTRAGDSSPFLLNTELFPVVDFISVTWDAAWFSGDANATVVITDNGTEVKRTTGAGDFDLFFSGAGRHELIYATYIDGVRQDEGYAATVYAKWKYEVEGGGVVIVGTTQKSGNVVVPSEIDGYAVTGIASCVFSGCGELTGVTFPDSVTNIGDAAFLGCSGLADEEGFVVVKGVLHYYCGDGGYVSVPNGVKTIGPSAFADCCELSDIAIPNSVMRIGESAFAGCVNLTRVVVPNCVTRIDEAAFSGCCALESLTLPFVGAERANADSREALFGWVFGTQEYEGGANAVQTYHYGNDGVYYSTNCIPVSLRSVMITDEASLGYGAFEFCSMLTNVVLNESLSGSWKSVFWGCSGLANITIPNGLMCIDSSVFGMCSSLADLAIPDSVTSVGYQAFYGCAALTNLTLGSGVKTIGECAFRDCSSLRSITIPKGVISVGKSLFSGCARLESLTLPFVGSRRGNSGTADALFGWIFGETSYSGGVATQQYYTKSNYKIYYIPSSLKSVALTDETAIGYRAFWHCDGIERVAIPQTVKSMGAQAFKDCYGLKGVYIDSLRNWCEISFGSAASNPLCYAPRLYVDNELILDLVIPFGVTNIAAFAFRTESGQEGVIKSVMMPSTVKYIGTRAFGDLPHLSAVFFEGDAPTMSDVEEPFANVSSECCAYVRRASTGWGVTIPGKWHEIAIDYYPQHTVTFDANGGICETNVLEVEVGLPIRMLPIPSRNNATFLGWFTAADGGERVGEGMVPDDAITLYAHWLEAPLFTPSSGTTFDDSLSVSISSPTDGASIYYTTNGMDPAIEGVTYKRFKIAGKTTVKAIAMKDGVFSEVVTAEYALGRCADPVILPVDGTVFEGPTQVVSMQWNETDGVLRYTLDGSEPTIDSPVYAEPLTISVSTVIKARVFSDNYFDSAVVTANLTQVGVDMPVIDAKASFTGSKTKVAISCATDGAIVRYTLNGNDPNSHSTKYTGPFYVTNSCTVKTYATKSGYPASSIATQTIEKIWMIGDTLGKPDHGFTTDGDDGAGWTKFVDATAPNGGAMKSGAIGNNQSSVLETKVMGPGTLTFSWRTSCEEDPDGLYEWDHVEFSVDGAVLLQRDGTNSWKKETVEITSGGEHAVAWTYKKDDVDADGEDAAWVAGYGWTSDYTATQTTEVSVPYAWLLRHDPEIVDEFDAYEAAAKAENGKKGLSGNALQVWQDYVAGTDPTNLESRFTAKIEMVDGVPVVTWEPDLNTNGIIRTYKVYGKETLEGGGEWQYPTNSLHRFFKVTVEMP